MVASLSVISYFTPGASLIFIIGGLDLAGLEKFFAQSPHLLIQSGFRIRGGARFHAGIRTGRRACHERASQSHGLDLCLGGLVLRGHVDG